MHQFTIQAISIAIPKLVGASTDWLTNLFFGEDPPKFIKTSSKSRKRRDCTPLTKQMYDFICKMNAVWIFKNEHRTPDESWHTKIELTVYLNKILHLDKSRTYYSRVWNGQIDREKLPEGIIISEKTHERSK